MKTYWYFISYNYWVSKSQGFGNCEIPVSVPITSIDNISIIQDIIKNERKYHGVIVNNYILLRETE